MKDIKKILSNEEIQQLVRKGEAKYIHWGQRRDEIIFTGKHKQDIYWKHTASHYKYLGKRDLTYRELAEGGF